MREVISAMKASTNLERIADHAVTIARRAKHLNDRPLVRRSSISGAALPVSGSDFSRQYSSLRRSRLRPCTDTQAEGQGTRRLNP
jgi:phosphate uptake regulator